MSRIPKSACARVLLALLGGALLAPLPAVADAVQDDSSTPVPSSGCGLGALEPGTHPFTIQYDGLERTFDIHVPQIYDDHTPTPLVLNLHSLYLGGSRRAFYTHISQQKAKSEEAGYIMVEPDGTGDPASWNGGARCCDPAFSAGIDDVGYIQEVVLRTLPRVCIDRRRIYATGMSNGGYLSHRLACEHPERIAAIAPVVGSFSPELQCAGDRGVPVLQISGEADNLESRQQSVDTWISLNECTTSTRVSQVGDFTCTTHDDCKDGVEVTHCVFAEGGHCTFTDADPELPGCPLVADNPAQDLIWEFVSRWRLPAPVPEPRSTMLSAIALVTLALLRSPSRSAPR